MNSIREDFETFRRQLEKGPVKRAYRALLAYMLGLRNHFKNGDPGYAVSGLYQGYMDMTYFALFPPKLKSRGLKIAIVFNYEAFRFEAWLSGKNQAVQRQYWELFREGRWTTGTGWSRPRKVLTRLLSVTWLRISTLATRMP